MNIALLLGLMQVVRPSPPSLLFPSSRTVRTNTEEKQVKHFDLASDSNRRPIQMIFGTVQISIIALLFYIRSRAQKNNSKTKVHVPKSAKGPAKTMTESEYDVSETESAIKSALVTLAIITGIHMYWGTLQPMIFQSILPLKNVLWDAPVARIYIWGDKATGKLERPFKVDSPLA